MGVWFSSENKYENVKTRQDVEQIPIKLSWRDISYKVMIKNENEGIFAQKTEKIILNNINGDVLNGKLVAIMV